MITTTASPSATTTIDTIYKRRAVRKYKNKQVEKTIIEKIIDAGRMAPSAMNMQSWKFYIITNADTIGTFSKHIQKAAAHDLLQTRSMQLFKNIGKFLKFTNIMDLLKGTDTIFHGAPVVIFITAPKNNEWAALDIGMCAQNMMLAAKSLGLDSCPIGLAKYAERIDSYSMLNIPGTEKLHIALIIGYGDELPEPHIRKHDNAFFID